MSQVVGLLVASSFLLGEATGLRVLALPGIAPGVVALGILLGGGGAGIDLVLGTLGASGPEIQSELKAKTGQSTVPNVFIRGRHIGKLSFFKKKF